MVDDFDTELQVGAILGHAPIRVEHPGGAELRLVDLKDEPGCGDHAILLANRLSHGHHVRGLIVVIFVPQTGAETEWSQCDDESLHIVSSGCHGES
jgi:hypothetical protein